jgi:hypothetical protein
MRTTNPALWLVLALGIAGAAACGPATPEPVTPVAGTPTAATTAAPVASGAPTAAPTAAPSAAPTATPAATGPAPAPLGPAFATMSNADKLQHMKKVIQPTMGQVFSDYDGKKYGEFGCRTCHGDKKQDPHVALPKLTLSGDGFQKLMAAKPALMKFMTEKVTPAMATAMGAKPFDPATHQGFGCGGCHTVN